MLSPGYNGNVTSSKSNSHQRPPSPPAVIRAATNQDGQAIRRLVERATNTEDLSVLNWDDIEPFWLVVERKGQIIGCLQFMFAKPVARLESLHTDPDLTPSQKARTIKKLMERAMELAKMGGISAVCGVIGMDNKKWRRAIKKRGAKHVQDCQMYVREV